MLKDIWALNFQRLRMFCYILPPITAIIIVILIVITDCTFYFGTECVRLKNFSLSTLLIKYPRDQSEIYGFFSWIQKMLNIGFRLFNI